MLAKTKKNLFKSLKTNSFPIPSPKGSVKAFSEDCSTDATSCQSEMEMDFNGKRLSFDMEMDDFNFELPTEEKKVESARVIRKNVAPVQSRFAPKSSTFNEDKKVAKKAPESKGLLYERIVEFSSQASAYITSEKMAEYKKLTAEFTQAFYECEEPFFKGYKVDSIADAMLLLVGTKIGLGKKEFLKCLRPKERLTPCRITEIKRFSCYTVLKKMFGKILAEKKN